MVLWNHDKTWDVWRCLKPDDVGDDFIDAEKVDDNFPLSSYLLSGDFNANFWLITKANILPRVFKVFWNSFWIRDCEEAFWEKLCWGFIRIQNQYFYPSASKLTRVAFKVLLKLRTFIIADENSQFRIELGLLRSSAPIDINLLITASG